MNIQNEEAVSITPVAPVVAENWLVKSYTDQGLGPIKDRKIT